MYFKGGFERLLNHKTRLGTRVVAKLMDFILRDDDLVPRLVKLKLGLDPSFSHLAGLEEALARASPTGLIRTNDDEHSGR